jgi:Mn-dependent DtxR family transcriptional regulator
LGFLGIIGLLRCAFVKKLGFEKDEPEKESDGDAHHVKADITERALAAGDG